MCTQPRLRLYHTLLPVVHFLFSLEGQAGRLIGSNLPTAYARAGRKMSGTCRQGVDRQLVLQERGGGGGQPSIQQQVAIMEESCVKLVC